MVNNVNDDDEKMGGDGQLKTKNKIRKNKASQHLKFSHYRFFLLF